MGMICSTHEGEQVIGGKARKRKHWEDQDVSGCMPGGMEQSPLLAYRSRSGWCVWSSRWNYRKGKPKYSENTCPSATLSTTNPTRPGLEPGRLNTWATAGSQLHKLPIRIYWDQHKEIPLSFPLACWYGEVRYLARDVSLPRNVYTGSGAQPTSYTLGTKSCFPARKAAGSWSWPLTSIQCEGEIWCYISTSPYILMACTSLRKSRDTLTFFLLLLSGLCFYR
jgi:hypothetical protein